MTITRLGINKNSVIDILSYIYFMAICASHSHGDFGENISGFFSHTTIYVQYIHRTKSSQKIDQQSRHLTNSSQYLILFFHYEARRYIVRKFRCPPSRFPTLSSSVPSFKCRVILCRRHRWQLFTKSRF